MLLRHGVKLSPKLADIFDMINRTNGIDTETLCWLFYPGKPRRVAGQAVAVSINHLNDLLEPTDFVIRMENRGGPYRVTSRV
jgi:hypothetical protein